MVTPGGIVAGGVVPSLPAITVAMQVPSGSHSPHAHVMHHQQSLGAIPAVGPVAVNSLAQGASLPQAHTMPHPMQQD